MEGNSTPAILAAARFPLRLLRDCTQIALRSAAPLCRSIWAVLRADFGIGIATQRKKRVPLPAAAWYPLDESKAARGFRPLGPLRAAHTVSTVVAKVAVSVADRDGSTVVTAWRVALKPSELITLASASIDL